MSKEFSTPAIYWRRRQENYNLLGTKCENCGNLMFGKRAVCTGCSEPIKKTLETSKSSK